MRKAKAKKKPTEKVARDLDYLTPPAILDKARAYFGGQIPLDAATTWDNPTDAANIFTPERSGLEKRWDQPTWVNPPYGPLLRPFLEKIELEARQGTEILALLPVNRTEQAYWQDMIARANAVCWVRKRVAFLRPSTGKPAKGNPYSSMLVGFNVDLEAFLLIFGELGRCQALGRSSGRPG